MRLDRRRFLKMSGGTAATLVAARELTGGRAARAAQLDAPPFCLGVASGDPAHDAVVLWTRLAPEPLAGGGMPDAPVPVGWEVARDESFGHIVARGEVVAEAALTLAPNGAFTLRRRIAAVAAPAAGDPWAPLDAL